MKRIFLDEDLIFVISFSTCYQLYSSISTTKLAKITGTLLEAVENIKWKEPPIVDEAMVFVISTGLVIYHIWGNISTTKLAEITETLQQAMKTLK